MSALSTAAAPYSLYNSAMQSQQAAKLRGAPELSVREEEVLRAIAWGRSNKEIARSLIVSERTVKGHVSNILGKLGLQDRTQAALYAVRHGLAPES